MATKTIGELDEIASAATGDWLELEAVASGLSKKIKAGNLMGGRMTGGGTIATGGFTLTVTGPSTVNGSLVGNISGGGTIATGGFTLTVAGPSTVNGSLVGNMTGGGTLATGGFTLTVPATGIAALKTGTPVANNVATWNDGNTVKDGGVAFDQMVRRIGTATTLNHLAMWHDDNTIKGTGIIYTDVARLSLAQSFALLNTFTTGISFGQSTLNWYQTGTWTPALTFGGSANGLTYQASSQIGRYVRAGTLVNAWASLRLATVGSSVGNAVVGGLPFASVNVTNHRPPITTAYASMSFTGTIQGINVNNTTDITLQIGNNGVNSPATNTNFTNTTSLYINLVYETA